MMFDVKSNVLVYDPMTAGASLVQMWAEAVNGLVDENIRSADRAILELLLKRYGLHNYCMVPDRTVVGGKGEFVSSVMLGHIW